MTYKTFNEENQFCSFQNIYWETFFYMFHELAANASSWICGAHFPATKILLTPERLIFEVVR